MVAGNKTDLPGTEKNALRLRQEAERLGRKCLIVSAMEGNGIKELIDEIVEMVRLHPRPSGTVSFTEPIIAQARLRTAAPLPVKIVKLVDGSGFRVEHANLEKAVARIDFDQDDALTKFARLLKRLKVEEALERAGAAEGDKVYIGEVEFDFQPDKIG
jgi:GTP-binding protein